MLCDFLLQGTGAGQLCSMEEAVLLPLQNERQRRNWCPGSVCVSRVCQKGTPCPSQRENFSQRLNKLNYGLRTRCIRKKQFLSFS